ncbi:MAG: CoA transferase subunit A [Peptoniphilaceae bacterium]|nr:CoA transferase subunit A [Peptoniphilaceae bacterium]MDY6019531.1 CoA transferase subunit A [Anaerococcus sp.]
MQYKIITPEEAAGMVEEGCRIMIGGFAGSGNPMKVVHAIEKKGVKNLTLIGNDTGDSYILDDHVGVLVDNHQIKKAIVTHIGRNPETCKQFNEGQIEVEFVPQGTLVERIRCAGYGLGAAITKTGVGTEIEEGKDTIVIDGEKYLVEKPIFADVCVVRVERADKLGNVIFHGSDRAHSQVMLTAAKTTIVQADEIVEVGELDPDFITVPGIFVDYIVDGGKND